MEKKEEKKGFWASLFAPKSCSCCCGSEIEEVKDNPASEEQNEKDKSKLEEQTISALAPNRLDKPKEENSTACSCSCDNC